MMSRVSLILLTAFGVSCTQTAEPPSTEAPLVERGIASNPIKLAFLCVTPGCDTTQQVTVLHLGDRRLAIKRIILSEEAREDFSITSSQPAPFILGVGSSFTVDVRYAPKNVPLVAEMYLAISYTDASPIESEDRVPAGELRIPLIRRLVGEPHLNPTPSRIRMGYVQPGSNKTVPLKIENDGYGNIAAKIASIDSGDESLNVSKPESDLLLPGKSVTVDVQWTPPAQATYLKSTLNIVPGGVGADNTEVIVEGTSFADPRLAVEPNTDLRFQEIPLNSTRKQIVDVVNYGGSVLDIQEILIEDYSGSVTASFPNLATSAKIQPLERLPLTVTFTGMEAGEHESLIRFVSNDLSATSAEIKVSAFVTEPKIHLDPESIDFGVVPMGWVKPQTVEIKNSGYGPLTVKNIMRVGGTSQLFQLRRLPTLPFVLEKEERITFEVEFRSETSSHFTGAISIESDDVAKNFTEIPLQATGADCNTGCPIANGSPSCSAGVCAVGSCNPGFFDTDASANNGCECAEVGVDPGSFCAEAIDKGIFKDKDRSQSSHTGILPTKDDVDILTFFAKDENNWFSGDDWRVVVRLDSTDPGMTMCVYRTMTDTHSNECFFNEETCGNYYYKSGAALANDNSDFIVKIFRTTSSAPTCTPYTVFMSNGL